MKQISTKRTNCRFRLHEPIANTRVVENMVTGQFTDLLLFLKLRQTNGAVTRPHFRHARNSTVHRLYTSGRFEVNMPLALCSRFRVLLPLIFDPVFILLRYRMLLEDKPDSLFFLRLHFIHAPVLGNTPLKKPNLKYNHAEYQFYLTINMRETVATTMATDAIMRSKSLF